MLTITVTGCRTPRREAAAGRVMKSSLTTVASAASKPHTTTSNTITDQGHRAGAELR